MQRRCAEPRRQHRFRCFSPWRASSTGRECGSGADQTARTAAPATRCNDVAQLGQFRDLSRFGNFGCTLGGTMGKGRERQIILKTDQRNILLEMGLGGKFRTRSSGWGENRIFSKAMFVKLKSAMARWVLTRVPAGPRPAPLRPSTIFQPRSDGVTGYVTSSHGAATPLRLRRNCHLAGNQPRSSSDSLIGIR
jgi:hypothetical protein